MTQPQKQANICFTIIIYKFTCECQSAFLTKLQFYMKVPNLGTNSCLTFTYIYEGRTESHEQQFFVK